MRVTNICVQKKGSLISAKADFIFSTPPGGKKAKVRWYISWFIRFVHHPLITIRQGFTTRKNIWYSFSTNEPVSKTQVSDAFFLLAVPLAVAANENLVFEASVSQELLEKTNAVQDFYAEVAKRRIQIQTEKSHQTVQTHTKEAQFFSLGLDSFYTLACWPFTTQAKPTLIYVDGYDVPFFEKTFLNHIHARVSLVAQQTKTSPLYIETNLRTLSDSIIGWGRYHVSALAAVGVLSGTGTTFVSGESFDAPDWGLRKGVENIYTTPSFELKLVGHEVARDTKLGFLAESRIFPLFLQHVRVCWENVRVTPLVYNCSACQKCLKMQLHFLLHNITDPPTFSGLTAANIEKLQLVEHVLPEWKKIFTDLQKKSQTDPSILAAIQKVMEKPVRK